MKKVFRKLALLSVAMLLAFAGCEDPIIEDLVNTDLPTIMTNEVSDITANGAKTGGYVSAQGGTEVVARGVCYSTTQNPTVGNSRTEGGQGMGGFTSILTGLTPATTYYIRAYATNQHGTAYGEERSFTTAEGTGDTGDTTQGEDGKPVVTTNQVVAIGCISAICGGNVVSEELVLARGICWSTSPNPTINNTFTNEGQGAGNFTSSMTELSPNTTYYVRAYATNVNGTSYGEEKSFMTSAGTGSINGYDWVDLGLPSGLKWATCNVGANSPEGYGNYYAWGETTTYVYSSGVTCGQQISDISGNAQYDAARANWGSTWRMPTKTEMQELRNNCTCTWTTQNGVNGMRVTGPSGNSIFLPAAGYCDGSSRDGVGEYGYYWSSTPDEIGTFAYYLSFYSGRHDVDWYTRFNGFTVRPVSD